MAALLLVCSWAGEDTNFTSTSFLNALATLMVLYVVSTILLPWIQW